MCTCTAEVPAAASLAPAAVEPAPTPETVPGREELRPGARVEALLDGAWHPGIVRRLLSDAGGVLVEVLWDGVAAVDPLSPDDVRKPAESTGGGALEDEETDQLLEAIPSLARLILGGPAPGGGGVAAADLGPEADGGDDGDPAAATAGSEPGLSRRGPWRWAGPPGADRDDREQLWLGGATTASVGHLSPDGGPDEKLWLGEAITPSAGYLSPESAYNFPWVCHMCCKKFMGPDSLPGHIDTARHRKKRGFPYTLEQWISHNAPLGFYEAPAGPPPRPAPEELHHV